MFKTKERTAGKLIPEVKTELDGFKVVTRNLVINAEKVVEEMDGLCIVCGQTEEMAEKYHLLTHYLDYLRRFCDGELRADELV